MIGLVLVTHGRLAAEFITAMEHVVGPQEAIEAICIDPTTTWKCAARTSPTRSSVDQGEGVIILTDLFGGTPSNLAISLMKSEKIEVIAGVNLPMLIRLEGARKAMGVRAAVAAAREAGRKYISVASEILGRGGRLTAVSREVEITNQRGLHARASAKFVNLAAELDARIEVEKDGNRVCGTSIMGLMMLGAAMGDTITIHCDGDAAEAGAGAAGRAGRGAVRRGLMPRQITAFSNDTVKRLRALRDKKARREEGLFLAEGLRILAEARDSGRLPEIIAYSPAGARHPLAAEIIAAAEAAGADVIETTPDILSKMSRQGQSADAARRLSPARHRAGRDRPHRVAAVDRRPGAARSRQYRHHPAHRRRGRRRRADPDRRQRRSLLGRGGARVDGRDVHAGGRDRALGGVPAWLRVGPGPTGRHQPQGDARLSRGRLSTSPASC